MSPQTKAIFEFGPFRLNPAERLLLRHQVQVRLPPKAFDALVVLVENRGHLLEKDELLRKVWPDTFVEESNLAQHISVLRKALLDGEDGPRYIETVPTRGYRFIAEVRELGGVEADSNILSGRTPSPQPSLGLPNTGVSEPIAPSHRFPTLIYAIAALALLTAVLILTLPWKRLRGAGPEPIQSLAVLPLQNLSADPAQEYLADGMTEALITDLAKIPGLKVISRTSIMQYKDSHKKLPLIAQELGVDGIIEGAVLRSGDRVRITAQLVRAATDQHIWAESYERDLGDLVALQGEVSRSIATQIQKQIAPSAPPQLATSAAVSPLAREDYLKGRYFWNLRSEAGYLKAIDYFQAALTEDPQYAQAYAGLADAYALLGSWPNASISRNLAMPKAKQAALKALQLDDHLAEAHTSLAFVEMHYDWKFKDAEKEFQQALQLSPSYSTAHQWFAYDLIAMRRMPEALAEIQYAERLDPASVIINNDLAEMLLYNAQFDAAIMQLHKVLQMDPNFSHAHAVLAWVYEAKKMYPEAIAEMRVAVKGSGSNWYIGSLAYACAIAGQQAEAQRLLRQLGRVSTKNYDTALEFAQAYAGLGNKAAAFRQLEMGYRQRSGSLILLGVQPEFRVLRADPRYADLMRRVGLPQ